MLSFRWHPYFEYFDFDNTLLDEKTYENILIYGVLYKRLIGAKTLSSFFDKVNGFIRDYDWSKYLVLFDYEKYDATYDRTTYLSGITYVFSYNYETIKIDSDDELPLEKTLTLHNVIIFIKSVFNKDQNYYYYNTFLGKCSYQ